MAFIKISFVVSKMERPSVPFGMLRIFFRPPASFLALSAAGLVAYFGRSLLAEEDFAACRELCARQSAYLADILSPVAHRVRRAATVFSGRKHLL
jgi:hypothetical protein